MLLARAPDAATLSRIAGFAVMRRRLASRMGSCTSRARMRAPQKIEREFFNLFIGVGRGELLPYGSYYLTGFLNERPLARLREDLRALGIERAEGQLEPEDHAAILCEIMAGLAGGPFATAGRAAAAVFSKDISRLGSAASSPIWSAPSGRLLSPCGNGRPAIHRDRDEAFALPA